jgi:hypothetical protein
MARDAKTSTSSLVLGNLPLDVQRALRQMEEEINTLRGQIQQNTTGLNGKLGNSSADLMQLSQSVRSALQANGIAPLSVASLPGVTGQAQKSMVPGYTVLPTTVATAGTVIYQNGQLYRSNGISWVAITAGGVLYNTHANRLTLAATSYSAGTLFYESDRTVFYVSNAINWLYAAGVMVAVLASRPVGLGASDAGFSFFASDILNTYEWSGSAWILSSNWASLTTSNAFSGTTETFTGTVAVSGTTARQQLSVGAWVDIYSNIASNSPTVSSIRGGGANNLLISAFGTSGTGAIYFNYDSGNGGVNFCNGASVIVASINAAGQVKCTSLDITAGSNTKTGSGTLTAGTVTIANTSVTANSKIFIIPTSSSATTSGVLAVTTKTVGTGFVVKSSLATDVSTFDYFILETS